MSPIPSIIAVLFALGSAGALAQNSAAPQPPTGKPVSDSATYGPVLDMPAPPASPQQAGEASPQAQEERAGQPPANKHADPDPSARPAPQGPQQQSPTPPQQDARDQPRQQAPKKPPQTRRRAVEQRIDPTARIVVPPPQPPVIVQPRVAPMPVGPQSSQVIGCMGSACADVNGGSTNMPSTGNAGVSSSGRLCTRSGANLQCI